MKILLTLCLVCGFQSLPLFPTQTQQLPLTSTQGLKLVNVTAESVTYNGRAAVRVTDAAPAGLGDEGRLAVLSNTDFQDGTIEVDLAGAPLPNAGEGARGFVGLAFRVNSDQTRFECIYLRPTNGRSSHPTRCSSIGRVVCSESTTRDRHGSRSMAVW